MRCLGCSFRCCCDDALACLMCRSEDERTLKVEFVGASSRTITRYKLADDGNKLRLKRKITDPRLPKPLRLGYTYRH